MDPNPYESPEPPEPEETEGRYDYYEAAFLCIVLICDNCEATLDPDEDLGPNVSFNSKGWSTLLADEAFRRGWQIVDKARMDYSILCPACAGSGTAPVPNPPPGK